MAADALKLEEGPANIALMHARSQHFPVDPYTYEIDPDIVPTTGLSGPMAFMLLTFDAKVLLCGLKVDPSVL
jgi:hypothetical protein